MARILVSIAALLTLLVAASLAIVLRPPRRHWIAAPDDGGGGGARRRPGRVPGAGPGDVVASPAIWRRPVPRQKVRREKRGARGNRLSRRSRA